MKATNATTNATVNINTDIENGEGTMEKVFETAKQQALEVLQQQMATWDPDERVTEWQRKQGLTGEELVSAVVESSSMDNARKKAMLRWREVVAQGVDDLLAAGEKEAARALYRAEDEMSAQVEKELAEAAREEAAAKMREALGLDEGNDDDAGENKDGEVETPAGSKDIYDLASETGWFSVEALADQEETDWWFLEWSNAPYALMYTPSGEKKMAMPLFGLAERLPLKEALKGCDLIIEFLPEIFRFHNITLKRDKTMEARYFEGPWACVACGHPFSARIYCYRAENLAGDTDTYLHETVALEGHECPVEASCSVEAGDCWSPLRDDVPCLGAGAGVEPCGGGGWWWWCGGAGGGCRRGGGVRWRAEEAMVGLGGRLFWGWVGVACGGGGCGVVPWTGGRGVRAGGGGGGTRGGGGG